MFVFLLALKHPDTANDYATVERLLSTTLHSLLGQTSEHFKIVVVCNRVPDIEPKDPRIHFHHVAFPPVSKVNGKLHPVEKFTDKGSKYLSGLLFAKQFNPSYVYIVDSDDWVNVDIVKFFEQCKPAPVWYVDAGCFVNLETNEYKKRAGLLRYCGSTFVYDYHFLMKVADIKNNIDAASTQQALIAATSEFFVINLLSNHLINYQHYKNMGSKPKPIPLRAACWIQGTGENVSQTAGGDAGLPIDKKFCDTFHVPYSFIPEHKQNLALKLRDFFAHMQSLAKWQYSKITGNKVF
ncbi:MAG: hypothetical protein GW763_04845 [Paraglaciecola sp.]|nr:hypothetical protein [Paraglaciecola sp.]NCT47314.1 hypothetical protein [Paraglaciecola sp.]